MVTKERIIDNATKLFMTRGCKSLTMDDISTANGISKRTLYEMFADKSALLEACLDDVTHKRKEYFDEVYKNTTNVLEFLLKVHDYESESMGNTSEIFIDEVKKIYPEVYDRTLMGMRVEHEKHTKMMLDEGRKQGVFIDSYGNIDLEAKILAMFVKAPATGAPEFDRNIYSRKELFLNTIVFYLRGLSTPKGMKIIDDFYMNNNKK